jgi:hypothetical protein
MANPAYRPYGPHDMGTSLTRLDEGYCRAVIRCQTCMRHWVRPVRADLLVGGGLGRWLCPAGWNMGARDGGQPPCAGTRFRVAYRPDVEAAWLLTGLHGYGDTEGCP